MNLEKKTNEKIVNLINHEYIEKSFLFNRIFMQRFFNTLIGGKI
jgi:hypothetical protein